MPCLVIGTPPGHRHAPPGWLIVGVSISPSGNPIRELPLSRYRASGPSAVFFLRMVGYKNRACSRFYLPFKPGTASASVENKTRASRCVTKLIMHNPKSPIPKSAIRNPPSHIRHSTSTIRNPTFHIHHHTSHIGFTP